jgi:hypothetical protein
MNRMKNNDFLIVEELTHRLRSHEILTDTEKLVMLYGDNLEHKIYIVEDINENHNA